MATLATCLAEKARLMSSPYRCVVKVHRAPSITDTGGATPDQTADDYLIWVKDPRTTGTGAGGTTRSQANSPTPVSFPTLYVTLRTGLQRSQRPSAPQSGSWRLYDVGGTRWSGLIPNSSAVFA